MPICTVWGGPLVLILFRVEHLPSYHTVLGQDNKSLHAPGGCFAANLNTDLCLDAGEMAGELHEFQMFTKCPEIYTSKVLSRLLAVLQLGSLHTGTARQPNIERVACKAVEVMHRF